MLSRLEYSKRVFIAVVIIIGTLVVPYALYKVFPHFTPFILAYFTALLLEPVAEWFKRIFRFKKLPSVTATYLLFLGIISLLSYFLISKLYVQLVGFLTFIQNNAPRIQNWILDLYERLQNALILLPPDTAAQINHLIVNTINDFANLNLVSRLGTYTISLSTAIPNFFFLFLIYFISVFLFSMQLENIHRRFYSLFKDSSKRKALMIISDLKKATFGFLKAQIILSTITFIMAFIGLSILKIKYSFVIAFIITVVDILPILGVGSVLMPWAVVTALQGKLIFALGLILLFIVIAVIRKSIEPKILGERIGLGALSTLISIWIGFKIMGVVGIFLLPLAFIFYKALVKVGVINLDRLRI